MEPYFKFQDQSVIAAAHGGGPWDPSMLHGGAPTALITRLVEPEEAAHFRVQLIDRRWQPVVAVGV